MSKEGWEKVTIYSFLFIAFWFGVCLMWWSALPDRFEAGVLGFFLTLGAFYFGMKKVYEKQLKEKDDSISALKNYHAKAKHE